MTWWKRPADLLSLSTAVEGVTGLGLVLVPGFVVWLLIAAPLDAAGAFVARVAGIALIALSIACWIGARGLGVRGAVIGMLSYNLLCAAYLAVFALSRMQVGLLLWPAVAFHAGVGLLLAVAWPAVRDSP
jgi:hypothetical protein